MKKKDFLCVLADICHKYILLSDVSTTVLFVRFFVRFLPLRV